MSVDAQEGQTSCLCTSLVSIHECVISLGNAKQIVVGLGA